MTTVDGSPTRPRRPRRCRIAVTRSVDAITMAWRNLLNIRRNPQLLVFATIQPVIFVRDVPVRVRRRHPGQPAAPARPTSNFLMPGIFVQTIVFGALTTGVGLADDLSKGLIDRFRSLPMARSAVLVGRTLADLVRNFFVVILMCAVGFIVGWTIEHQRAGDCSAASASSSRSPTRCRGCSPSSASR